MTHFIFKNNVYNGDDTMEKIKLSKIGITNIQSYYGNHVVDLSKLQNFILVNGKNINSEKQSNGSGKSTLFK
jgi:DNA repair exonuclease SbcCD ATPase subunit